MVYLVFSEIWKQQLIYLLKIKTNITEDLWSVSYYSVDETDLGDFHVGNKAYCPSIGYFYIFIRLFNNKRNDL